MDRPHPTRPPQVASEEHPETLIPKHIVDHASQRLVVLLIFAAIQCWKVYDILLVKADAFAVASAAGGASATAGFTALNNFTFVLKYAFIDGVFLWLLPVLNIPLLTFLPLSTLLLTAAMNLANFVLTSNSVVPLLSSTFVPLWNLFNKHKVLTILGDSVPAGEPVDMNSHFKGRYTIQYLPESSAMLNPFGFGNMCLESPDLGSYTFPSSIQIPIELNTTNAVGAILLQRLAPDNTVEYLNYSRSEIRKLARKDHSAYAKLPQYVTSDTRVFYVDAEISRPGTYKIHRVVDVDGMVIRAYKSEFSIGFCPSAKLVYPGPESAYSQYKCFKNDVGDIPWTVPMVSAFGILPLNVEFAAFQNGRKITTFEKSIKDSHSEPDKGASWLQSRELTRNAIEQELLRAPQIFHSVSPGLLEFQVLSVTDARGNRRLYNDKSKDKDVNFAIELKQEPILVLRDKYPAQKLVLNLLKTLYIESARKPNFPVKVTLLHEDEQRPSNTKTLNFTFQTQDDLARGLQIYEPGSYILHSGSDKYCSCEPDTTPVTIVRPPLPSVKIQDLPIFDKCVGTIGYEFDIKFHGTAPFEILYQVLKNSSGIIKPVLSDRGSKLHRQKSLEPNYNFEFKPKTEGNYILIFESIKDSHYNKDPVPVSESENTFSTYIKKRSQFGFFKDAGAKLKTINLCKDQLAQVPVYFDGHFPFSFTHDIVDLSTGRVLKSERHEKHYDNSAVIDVPKFVHGGEYGIRLHDVIDNLGCAAEIPYQQEFRIRARKDTPLIEIADSGTSTIVEGDAVKIPLVIKSSSGISSEDEIICSWTSLYDQNHTKNFTLHGKSGLIVRDEGFYRLETFSNAGCYGQVLNRGKTFTLRHYPKPNITVVPEKDRILAKDESGSFTLKPLCQDDREQVSIKLEGMKPFVVSYEIKFPSGRLKTSLLEIDNNQVMIPLPSLHKGSYQIYFSGVSDSLYTREKLQKLTYKHKTSAVSYEVKAHPVLRVSQAYVQMCETKVKDLQIPVTLEGAAPYRVEGTILNKKEGKSERFVIQSLREPVIRIAELGLKESYLEKLSVGEHVINFESVSDASHCKSLPLTENNQMVISITQVPSITKQEKKDYYCVGDRISYNMSGISPFVVFYKFNDQNRKAELSYEFTRLASKPGDLAIVALQDSSAGQCLVNFTKQEEKYENLKLKVHELPSVEISHGDSIIKNLHEGDKSEITFKFIGTPPFLVTYVRTLETQNDQRKRRTGSKRHKGTRSVVETKTVKDIWDYEYSEVVSLQGTYDAIEVTDAFCRASRDVHEIL